MVHHPVPPDDDLAFHFAACAAETTYDDLSAEAVAPAEELEAKFRGCLAFAGRPEFERRADRIVEAVDQMEEMSDVRELAELLAPGKEEE